MRGIVRFLGGFAIVAVAATLVAGITVTPLWLLATNRPGIYALLVAVLLAVAVVVARIRLRRRSKR